MDDVEKLKPWLKHRHSCSANSPWSAGKGARCDCGLDEAFTEAASRLHALAGERKDLLAANERLARLGRIVERERDDALASVEKWIAAFHSSQAELERLRADRAEAAEAIAAWNRRAQETPADATDLFEALHSALVEGTPTLSLRAGRIWIDGETAFDAGTVLAALRAPHPQDLINDEEG